MSTFVVPKLPKTVTKSGGETRYHTIHIDRHIFTVQKNGTSVLAFRREKDVTKFSKMIESHFDLTHEWPVINFEDTILYKNTRTNRLKYIVIKEWNENMLVDWCIKNAFNMLDISSFEGDNRLVGRAISWDVNQNFYVNFLNEKLNV